MPPPSYIPESAIVKRPPFPVLSVLTPEFKYPHLLQGLVGAWSPCLQADRGSKLWDLSGRGNHGTLTNMDTATDWVVSGGYGALDFDGSNDRVETTFTPIITTLSLSVFLFWGGDLGRLQVIVDTWNGGNPYFRFFFSSGNRYSVAHRDDNGANETTVVGSSYSSFSTGVMDHFVAVRCPGKTTKLFLNGNLLAEGSTSSSAAINSGNLVIGADGSAGATPWKGGIVDLAAFAGEVDAKFLYSLGPGGWAERRRRPVVSAGVAGGPFPHYTRRVLTGGMAV